MGLLHILIGSTPENYQWVATLLGLRGNIKQGLAELQNVIQKDSMYSDEAQLIEYLIHAFILKFTPKKLADFQAFIQQNPDNQLFTFFGITTLMKEGKSEVLCEQGQLIKVSKDKNGVVTRDVLTKEWTDWVDYWAVDFDYLQRKEIIKVPRGIGLEGTLPSVDPVPSCAMHDYAAPTPIAGARAT